MSENQLGFICDEEKVLAYIYDDVDDSDIFASEPINNSSTENDPRSETELSTEPNTSKNSEKTKENEFLLQETVEKLQKEKEILHLRISELYKTARAELERKDRRLKELEKEKDNILFRRESKFVGNKSSSADLRLPVMQQVEIDLINEKAQNYNARYRIPKIKSSPVAHHSNTPNKTSTENEELSKNKLEARENQNTQNEKHSNDKYWSAYPHLKDEPTKDVIGQNKRFIKANNEEENKGYQGKQLLADKESRDRHIIDRSRPGDKFDSRESEFTEKKLNKQSLQSRSKSVGRYKSSSPQYRNRQPRTPSLERERIEVQKNTKIKGISADKATKPKDIICFNPTSQEKEEVCFLRRKSRSPTHEKSNLNTKSLQTRSKSVSRPKPKSPKYQIRQPKIPREMEQSDPDQIKQPRTPSREKEATELSKQLSRIRSQDGNENKKLIRSKSVGRYNPCSPKHQNKRPRTPSREREEELESRDNRTNRSKSRLRDKDIINREPKDSRSSWEKENICTSNRKSRRDDFMQNDCKDHRGNLNSRKPEEKEASSSRTDTNNSSRVDNYENKCSARGKCSEYRNYCDGAGSRESRDKCREEHRHFDIRERIPRRPRSISRERNNRTHNFRRSRSASRERYLRRPPERERYRYFRRDKSRSLERDLGKKLRRKASSPVRREHGNSINYKYRRNTSRSNSREMHSRLNIRASRSKDFGRLRERLLRYSIDREKQALENAVRDDRNLHQKNKNKKKTLEDNETDQSDLDDLKLHLSGESDIESLNMENSKKHRNNHLNSEDDDDLKLLLDLGVDPRTVTEDQLQRLLEKRKDLYNEMYGSSSVCSKEIERNDDCSDLEEHFNVQFSKSDGELTDSDGDEDNDTNQIQRKNNEIWHPHNEEELDYEGSQHEFPNSVTDHKVEELQHVQSTESELRKISDHDDRLEIRNVEKEEKYASNVIQQTCEERNSCEYDQKQFKTMFEFRQHKRNMKIQNLKKGMEPSQIIRSNVQVLQSEKVGSVKEKKCIPSLQENPKSRTSDKKYNSERTNQPHISERENDKTILKNEAMHKTSEISENSGLEVTKKRDTYNHMFKDIDILKQECKAFGQACHSTRSEITATLSKVTKETDLVIGAGDCDNLNFPKEKTKDEVKIKALENVEKVVDKVVTKKRETISLLAYKSRRKSVDVKLVDAEDFGSFATNTLKNIQIERKVPTKASEETILEKNLDLPVLPTSVCSIQENEKNKESDNTSEVLIQNNEKNVENVPEDDSIKINNEPELNEINMGIKMEDQGKENDFHNPSSFIHDFSISDDDDDRFEEPLSEGDKKINILSDIKIQSPSCTLLLRKDSAINELQTAQPLPEIKKEPISKNSRRSLFSKDIKQTEEAVANIPTVEDKFTCTSGRLSSPQQNTDGKTWQNLENIPQIGSKATGPQYSSETSECIDEIQEAVNNMIGNSTIRNNTSNKLAEQFNTEEDLQKCLEEGISKQNSEDLNNKCPSIEKRRSSLQAPYHTCKTEIKEENKDSGKDGLEQRKKTEKKQQPKQNRSVTPPPKGKTKKSSAAKMLELFGTISPSPGKAMVAISEGNVHTDKAKRNIVKFDETYSGNSPSFKIRDKNEDSNKKDLNKPVNNAGVQNRKGNIRARSKSVDEKKFQETLNRQKIITKPKDEIKCELMVKCEVEKKPANHLSNFCNSNPTYIPNIRDTPKMVFDSPNHYIKKKNEEGKEKARRNLNENHLGLINNVKNAEQENTEKLLSSSKTVNDGDTGIDCTEEIIKKSKQETSSALDLPVESKSKKQTYDKKQKRKAEKTSSDEESSESEEENERKTVEAKAKRTKKNFKNKNVEVVEVESPKRKKDEKKITKARAKRAKKDGKNSSAEVQCSEREEDTTNAPKVKAKRAKKDAKNSSAEGQCSEREEDTRNAPKVKAKRTKTNVKNKSIDLTVRSEDKKVRNSSFKIKINRPKKRRRSSAKEKCSKQSVNDSEDSSDLFEESYESDDNSNNKKQKVEQRERSKDSVDPEKSQLSDSHQGKIDSLVKVEKIKLNKKAKKPKLKGTKHKKAVKDVNLKEEKEIEEQTCERINQRQKVQVDEIKLDNPQKQMSQIQLEKTYFKDGIKVVCIEEKSKQINSDTTTSTEHNMQSVKPIKRITPKRIDDSTFKKQKEQKFNELNAKRELVFEKPSLDINVKKRQRQGSGSEDYRGEKCQQILYTETRETIEDDVIDNGALTRVKLQETHLTIEVAPNSSPLPRIEQTYDILSRSKALNNAGDYKFIDVTHPQLQPSHEGVFPEIGLHFDEKHSKNTQLHVTESTFAEIHLDTKDFPCTIENNGYFNLLDISISDKSLLLETIGVQNVKEGDQLNFANFLKHKDSNASTPIKHRAVVIKTESNVPITEADSKEEVKGVNSHHTRASSNKPNPQTSVTPKSSSNDLRNTSTSICSNADVSDNKASLEITGSVCSINFSYSRTLKRDRRRPISMVVID